MIKATTRTNWRLTPTVHMNECEIERTLEALEAEPGCSERLASAFNFEGRKIKLNLVPDSESPDVILDLSRGTLANIGTLNDKARAVASAKLLPDYNNSWRTYAVMTNDGVMEDRSDPPLDRASFEARIHLVAVSVIGSMLEFQYSDEGMFAGHSIIVTAFDGLSFSDTHAEVFG